MQNNFPKIQFFSSIFFLFISLFAFFYFFRTINTNYDEFALKELEWQTESDRREGIKALDRSVKMIEIERAELQTHFAKSSDIVPFLDTIEELAPKVSVKTEVTAVEILKEENGLIVDMKASGTFRNIYKFLTLLENSPYELEFVSIQMNRETALEVKSESGWGVIFRIKLLSFIK